MDSVRKKLLWSIIFVILYYVILFFSGLLISDNKEENILNIVIIVINLIAIIYEFILVLNEKINLNHYKKGIVICSIIFFVTNIISGILGFISNGELVDEREKRQLPKIELKEYTNKYLCLGAFVICILILLFGDYIIKNFISMILAYAVMFLFMIFVFRKQLVHDVKIFKEYFKEYSSLVLKSWGKALVLIVIASLIISIVTGVEKANNQAILQDSFNNSPILIALLAVIYAPITEELMFRGVIRKFIKNDKLFIIISGVLFGLMHVIDDSKTLAEFSYVIVYSILGITLSSLYAKTNNICTNIFMHFIQNSIGVLGMFLLTFM